MAVGHTKKATVPKTPSHLLFSIENSSTKHHATGTHGPMGGLFFEICHAYTSKYAAERLLGTTFADTLPGKRRVVCLVLMHK